MEKSLYTDAVRFPGRHRSDRIYDVSTKGQLLAALATGSEPKIIRVVGDIAANARADGSPISCESCASGTGYSLAQYLCDFDPVRYGTAKEPEGPRENARRLAASKQAAAIRWDIPSNTTIVGAGPDSSITGAALRVNGAENVVFRNLAVRDAADCFPS